jgi:ribosomal-protein-alanine N-acetyltransferase
MAVRFRRTETMRDALSAASRATRLPIVLREAHGGDVPAIAEIERRSFADPWSEHAFATSITATHAYVRVAADPVSGELLGYMIAWFVADEGEIANIAVAPAARGRGVGARLLDDVLSRARSLGVRNVYLEVRESNVTAQELYGSRRFVEIGRRRRYYSRPVEDALILRATLDEDQQ